MAALLAAVLRYRRLLLVMAAAGIVIPSGAHGTSFGVLKLVLHGTSYDWQFVPIDGQGFSDFGSASCVMPQTP